MADAFQRLHDEREKEAREKREQQKIEENKAIAEYYIKMGMLDEPQTQPEAEQRYPEPREQQEEDREQEAERAKQKKLFIPSKMAEEPDNQPVLRLGRSILIGPGKDKLWQGPERPVSEESKKLPERFNYRPGYDELLHLVAGLQKDVKRIQDCVTLEGANDWIKRYKKNGWTVYEDDITGPKGVPDGIKEIFVVDKKGNLRIVNGWALKKSDFPLRKAYRLENKTKDARKMYPFVEYMHDVRRVDPDVVAMNSDHPAYRKVLTGEFKDVQTEITPLKIYKAFITKPCYDARKDTIKVKVKEAIDKAKLFNNCLRMGYNMHVSDPVLMEILQTDDLKSVEPKVLKKTKRGRDYNKGCYETVKQIVTVENNLKAARKDIEDALDDFLA